MARVLVRLLRKVLTFAFGSVVVLTGVLLLVLPGPGWVVIFAGLGILAAEFTWARRLRDWLVAMLLAGWRRARRGRGASQGTAPAPGERASTGSVGSAPPAT
jgi:uncharacterized protein (TIGR02611 family)